MRAPLRIFLRQTLCRIFGQTLGQKPSGPAAPRVFGRGSGLRCGFGFAFGKSFGVPSIYSLGNRLRTLGTSLGNSFTTLHPRLFNRLYQSGSMQSSGCLLAEASAAGGFCRRVVFPMEACQFMIRMHVCALYLLVSQSVREDLLFFFHRGGRGGLD